MSSCAGAGREHGQADSQAGHWKYSKPWMSCSAFEWGLTGGRNLLSLVSISLNPPLSWKVELFCEFSEIRNFQVPQLLLGDWLRIGHQVVRKIVLYIVCFAYSLLSVLL